MASTELFTATDEFSRIVKSTVLKGLQSADGVYICGTEFQCINAVSTHLHPLITEFIHQHTVLLHFIPQ